VYEQFDDNDRVYVPKASKRRKLAIVASLQRPEGYPPPPVAAYGFFSVDMRGKDDNDLAKLVAAEAAIKGRAEGATVAPTPAPVSVLKKSAAGAAAPLFGGNNSDGNDGVGSGGGNTNNNNASDDDANSGVAISADAAAAKAAMAAYQPTEGGGGLNERVMRGRWGDCYLSRSIVCCDIFCLAP
jgi:hypothetical protein